MKTHRIILASLTATLLMGLAVTAASARNLSLSNQNFRILWNALVFTDGEGIGQVTCPVTLEGSFHSRTIAKVRGTLIGYVTRADVPATELPCRGGRATVDRETIPWHVRYEAFSGTLPNITRVRILFGGVSFRVTVSGTDCGYRERGGAGERAAGEINIDAGRAATTLTLDTSIRLERYSGIFLCPARGGFSGSGTVTLLNSSTRITITLM